MQVPCTRTDVITSTSQWQGRKGDRPSEGSLAADVRADGQKPHTRLSSRASQHHMTKPTGSGDRVNAAVVHGKFTFLSGEICATCDRIVMRESGTGQTRRTRPRRISRCRLIRVPHGNHEPDSISRRTPIAPTLETGRVSAQKSADGIVVSRISTGDEGQNAERRKGIPYAPGR